MDFSLPGFLATDLETGSLALVSLISRCFSDWSMMMGEVSVGLTALGMLVLIVSVGASAWIREKHRFEERIATAGREIRGLTAAMDQERLARKLDHEAVLTLCHELRTPLSIIDAHAQKISRRTLGMGPDEIKARSGAVREAAARMNGMIGALLVRPEKAEDAGSDSWSHVDLAALIQGCRDRIDTLRSGRIRTSLDFAGYGVLANAAQLEQVFTNLLSNAIKYSPVSSDIEIRGWADGAGQVHVEVSDQGFGIPDNEIEAVFSRYFRASTGQHVPGTGIGLAHVKQVVERHGGGIGVTSIVGEGSVFTVTLPASYPANQNQPETVALEQGELV